MTSARERVIDFDQLVEGIPTCLDEIVTQGRDRARLYLATDEQMAGLARIVPGVPDQQIKGGVENWRVIIYEAKTGERIYYGPLLLGDNADGPGVRITSPLVGLDLGSRLAVTQSGSIYRLHGDHAAGEPPQAQLLKVCATFWEWGFGEALGVLPIWY